MRKITLYVYLFIPFLGLGQNSTYFELPDLNQKNSSLIEVSPNGNDVSFFLITTISAKSVGRFSKKGQSEYYDVNVLNVYDFNAIGELQNESRFILDHANFPNRNHRIIGHEQEIIGDETSVKTYDELKQLYFELEDHMSFDDFNKLRPTEYYNSNVIASKRSGKIKNLKFKKFEQAIPESNNAEVRAIFAYTKTLDSKLDWKAIFPDQNQDGNFDVLNVSMEDEVSGEILMLTSPQNSNAYSAQKNFEIKRFDPSGALITNQILNYTTAWQKVKEGKFFSKDKGLSKIDFMTILFRQNKNKIDFPNVDLKQVKLLGVESNGNVLYDHDYSLPINYSLVDTIMTTDDKVSIAIVQGDSNEEHFFALVSSKGKQKMYNVKFEKGEINRVVDVVSYNDYLYLVCGISEDYRYQFGEYRIIPIFNGELREHLKLKLDQDNATQTSFDVVVNDDQHLMVETKELHFSKAHNGNYVVPKLYEIKEGSIQNLNSKMTDGLLLHEPAMNNISRFIKSENGYYFYRLKPLKVEAENFQSLGSTVVRMAFD